MRTLPACCLGLIALLAAPAVAPAEETPWKVLIDDDFAAWKVKGDWQPAADVTLEPSNDRKLAAKPGKGVIWNGPKGRTTNLVTKENFGDLEAHVEFLVPKKSNSGVKFNGLYEVQILDSYGVEKPKGSDCGGIYPRAELLPRYRYLDQGTPPRVNAAKPAGEWQSLDMVFQAPRFDSDGKKTANARFVKVVLNGAVIHEDVEQATPTGHAWKNKETATGPLLLQADHGPVAFRNIRVRPYVAAGGKK